LNSLTAEKIAPDEVHIHLLRMNSEERFDERFLTLLPADEQAEYRRFQSQDRRRKFLWSRLLLRYLLAGYLKKDMRDLKFDFQEHGKPFLPDSELRFNLSHTTDLIACSFSLREVGIDVERVEPKRPWALIAKRFFTSDEVDYLFSCSDDLREGIFYQIFTMKEAYVKAAGRGVGFLGGFTVPLPLAEHSSSGRWEYFSKISQPDGYCLSHVVDNGTQAICRYQTRDWDQKSLSAILEKCDFFFQRVS
jgi:4'-phosphopantetheinyl transferase